MAETSYLWDNPGTGDSPALGYGNSILSQVIHRMLFNGTGNQGVLLGWLNNLEVTDGGALNASVNTGGAFCYGVWYENDAAATVALPNNSTVHVVVRADWATQTSRLTQVAALVQNPGVTYDIPLAQVTTLAGAITLITDTRDYCEFSTEIWDFAVTTTMLVADSATIAKMLDQDRWFNRCGGALAPDGTNPAAWTALTVYPRRNGWLFLDAATNSVWTTIRVPEDITSANLSIRVWANADTPGASGDIRWLYSIWQAADGGVAANTTGNVVQTLSASYNWTEETLVDLAVTAGDLLHIQISRDGTHIDDTLAAGAPLHAVYFYYTADS